MAGTTSARYPAEHATSWTLKDGTPLVIRPIRPDDESLMAGFHQQLSERSVYLRYFQMIKLDQRIAHEQLQRSCCIDYDRDMTLVAVRKTGGGQQHIIATGSLNRFPGGDEAETAILVVDRFQNQGLGTEILRRLLDIARTQHVRRVTSIILPENILSRAMCKRLGFHLHFTPEDHTVRAELILGTLTIHGGFPTTR
jgi:acetyltransferase